MAETLVLGLGNIPLADEVVFWGAPIESLGVGLELSPAVAAQVDALAGNVLVELAHWDIKPQPKHSPT